MRQYVGARYVPKFFDDGNGSNEWAGSSIPYEFLTIVTHLNNSYTSKKSVPVGVDISDTSYWVLTGDYNSAINDCLTAANKCLEIAETITENILYLNALPESLSAYNIEPGEDIKDKLAALFVELGNTDTYVLRFPSETYDCGGLTVPGNFILEGYGTTINATQSTGYMLTVSNTIRGFRFKGDNAAGDPGTTATKDGVSIIGAYISFYDLRFYGFNIALNLSNDDTCMDNFIGCVFSYNELCINGTTPSDTNSGERLTFIGCTFGSR